MFPVFYAAVMSVGVGITAVAYNPMAAIGLAIILGVLFVAAEIERGNV